MIPITRHTVTNPELLEQFLRNLQSLVYSYSSGNGPGGAGSRSMANLLNGISQPAQARLVLGLRELAVIKCELAKSTRPSGTTVPGAPPFHTITDSSDDWKFYQVGSIWIFNNSSFTTDPGDLDEVWMLVRTNHPTPSAAVWKRLDHLI
jgi:hypothetical protein